MTTPETPAAGATPTGAGTTPAGWYDDGSGRQRWWDGSAWQQFAPQQTQQPIQVNVTAPAGRQANYTRQQKGHSLTAWIFISLLTGGIGAIWLIYFSVSPNHYWHA